MRSKFKDEHPFEKRKAEAERIVSTYLPLYPIPPTPSSIKLTSTTASKIQRPHPRHLREGREVRHCDHRQEEVPGTRGPDRRSVRLCNPQAHQAFAREGHLHLRRRGAATDRRTDVLDLRGA